MGDPTYGLYGEAGPLGGLEDVSMIQTTLPNADDNPIEILPRSASVAVQQAWTTHHPPNDKPMCLHAALLEFPHPETGERMKWELPPQF